MPIIRHIVVISGFRQQHGRQTTGVDEIWYQLHQECSGPDCAVHLCSWNDDFRGLAALIKKYTRDWVPTVEVIAYSWGVGHGMVRLAEELQRYDIPIQTAYSIDGIYRSSVPGFLWRSMTWTGLNIAPTIRIPNVQMLKYWRQRNSLPQGHDIELRKPNSKLISGDRLNPDGYVSGSYTHQTIDNMTSIRDTIVEELS